MVWYRLTQDAIVRGSELFADSVLNALGERSGPTHVTPLLANK